MAHHQALSQHQTVAAVNHQEVHQNRNISTSTSKEDNCKDRPVAQIEVAVKEEQRIITEVVHREKVTETRLPVISIGSG